MNLKINALKKTKLFLNLDEQVVERLYSQHLEQIIKVSKGETFVFEGERLDRIYIVLSGEVCVTKINLDGTQALLQKALPSYALGIDIVFTRSRLSPFNLKALEDTSLFFY